MKILGLLGVWLWLGTLLADAGGAEKARLHGAPAEDLSAHEFASAAWPAAKSDATGGDFSTTGFALPVSYSLRISPRSITADGAEFPAAEVPRRVVVAWHFGQGPPPAAA